MFQPRMVQSYVEVKTLDDTAVRIKNNRANSHEAKANAKTV